VDELYVVPDARGRGVGSAALKFVMNEARMQGLRALHLEVMPGNERALELYQRHGFDDTRRHLMNKWW
jgi:ribosomal protein S18 acetylase RimI-like enzyme